MKHNRIPLSFYQVSALELAPKLLGQLILCDDVLIRILETEAYMPDDSACHAYKGKTKRNTPMFAQGGIWYVYLCYGLHQMLNIVSGAQGSPQAVLIRGGEVLAGHEQVIQRRGNLDLIGPGKLGKALGLDRTFSGEAIGTRIDVLEGAKVTYSTHPRIGIDYAQEQDRNALWRFVTSPMTPSVQKKNPKKSQ